MSFMSKITTAAAIAAFAVAATPASAAVIVTLSGDTTGGPTFNRPVSSTALSSVGTAVSYNTFLFSMPTAGAYTFLLTSTTPSQSYDTFLLLYTGIFSSSAPLSGLLTFNDDLNNSLTQSGFTVNLAAGQVYTAVIAGFDNLDFGNYTFTISNAVSAVPEPATWAMMIAGFGMVGFGMRRRAKPSVRVTFA